MDKQSIRNKIKKERNNLSSEEVEANSSLIMKSLLQILPSYNIDNIFIYNSFKNEVETQRIIEFLLDNNKNVYLPKIINNKMVAVSYTNNTQVKENNFGIIEPIGSPIKLDNFICIMPLIVVDLKGNRIGFGKGYYDTFLKNKNCIKIGLCHDFQIIKSIPCEEHDIPLDIIISEKRTIKLR